MAGEVDADAAAVLGQQLHAVAPQPAVGEDPMHEQRDRALPYVGEADAPGCAAMGGELFSHVLLLVCRSVGNT
ncbi:hypothetical protein [Rhodococcus qingshengii]|uniref:hypothetical protein n=1 Tax=Rhodococcus qingshengii TaxID=334542 RepID=UPI0033F1931F